MPICFALSSVIAQGLLEDPVMVIILGVLAVLVWGVVFLVRRGSKQVTSHVQALGAYAKEHGYGYEPGVVEGLAEQLPGVSLGQTPSLSSATWVSTLPES